MDSLDKIDWSVIWDVIKDIIIPHTTTLTFNIILFLFLGFIASIFYIVLLSKKKVLKRIPKYYNWIVKLYIPILIVAMLYFFGVIGFFTGTYKILHKESETIVSGLYTNALRLSFDSEESKNDFIVQLQKSASKIQDNSEELKEHLKATTSQYNTGYTIIDNSKNSLTNFLIDTYGDDIYKVVFYGMLTAAGSNSHINITESLSYEEFNNAMDILLDRSHEDIEKAIKAKLAEWLDDFLYSQYKSLVISQILLLLVVMIIPLIEFLIYKKWIEPKYSVNTN